MPQLQTLVLKDRAATPVSHTFVPRDITQNVGAVVSTDGTPIGDKLYTISLRKTPELKYKATVKLAVPVTQLQTINGIETPVVVRTSFVDCTFTFDRTSTKQERDDVVGMFADSLGTSKVLVNNTVVNLEGVY